MRRILLITGAALLIVGFANAADFGFGGKTAYSFLAAGGAITVLSVVHSLTTKQNAILPPASVPISRRSTMQADGSAYAAEPNYAVLQYWIIPKQFSVLAHQLPLTSIFPRSTSIIRHSLFSDALPLIASKYG